MTKKWSLDVSMSLHQSSQADREIQVEHSSRLNGSLSSLKQTNKQSYQHTGHSAYDAMWTKIQKNILSRFQKSCCNISCTVPAHILTYVSINEWRHNKGMLVNCYFK